MLERQKKYISDDYNKKFKKIEDILFGTLKESLMVLENVHSIKKKVASPNIANIQVHVTSCADDELDQDYNFKKGYVNSHLCLNAETRTYHTECDVSYTVVAVPSQPSKFGNEGEVNKGHFEFQINNEFIVVIPMKVGIVFSYSGFMLTHRQQIYRKDQTMSPFINIVLYNSKRLFNNMVTSFRRYLNDKDEKKNSTRK